MKPWHFVVLLNLLFTLGFSCCASAQDADNESRDDTQTYHVFDDVYLLSTLKMVYKKPRIVVKSVFPQLQSDSNADGILEFNEAAKDLVEEEINGFVSQVIQSNKTSSKAKNYLYIDYSTSAIQSGSHHILSIRFAIQGFIAGLNSSYHYYRVFNYDLENKQKMELQDLFKPDSNYLDLLSNYSENILNRRLAHKEFIGERTAAKDENFKNWNLKPRGLVITFNEYRVGPYHADAQTVIVPFSVLKKVLSVQSSIAQCAFRKKCGRKNLLTGGFIDEAVNAHHGFLNPVLRQI